MFQTKQASDQKTKKKGKKKPHHFPTTVSLSLLVPLSASCAAVAPQEELSVVDCLGDHITLAQET